MQHIASQCDTFRSVEECEESQKTIDMHGYNASFQLTLYLDGGGELICKILYDKERPHLINISEKMMEQMYIKLNKHLRTICKT